MGKSQNKLSHAKKLRAAELIAINENGGTNKQRKLRAETEMRMRKAAFPELFSSSALILTK